MKNVRSPQVEGGLSAGLPMPAQHCTGILRRYVAYKHWCKFLLSNSKVNFHKQSELFLKVFFRCDRPVRSTLWHCW